MTVAELFVNLGFKVEGEEQLKSFEKSLQNIAMAARQAALAMKILSRTTVPKALLASTSKTTPGTAAKPIVVQPTAPTALPSGTSAPPGNTAVNQGLKSLTTFAKQLVGFSSLAYVLKSLISSMAAATKASLGASFGLERFTTQTGLSRDELKSWEAAAARADVSQEEIRDQISKLAMQTAGMQIGQHQGEAATMARFGINPSGTPQDILRQFGQRFSSETLANAQMFGSMMGINPNVAFMMRANRGRVAALPPGQGLTTAEQSATMRAEAELNRLKLASESLRDRFVAMAATVGLITEPLKLLGDFIRGYNLLLSPAGRPANWPLPRGGGSSSTTVGPTKVDINVHESANPNTTAKMIQRAISDASYQRAPTWNGPAPAPQ